MAALGYVLLTGSGLVMLIFELIWFYRWWDVLGVIIAIVVAPIAAVFPFIYLVKEGFSLLYFGVWAVGLVGAAMAASDS